MNGDCQITDEELCHCCEGIGVQTPQPITNRPSLSQISYRVGIHDQFKSSMLAQLSSPLWPALGALRTRDDSDFTIALLDAFATVGDVLCFYQERLANEAYLRTAVEQRSVFELAALVGYQPAPGVAASTYIAFTLSSAKGSPDNVLIPAQSRVQSIPGPGQSPQVFETSTDITAQITYNALAPQTTQPASVASGMKSLMFSGSNLGLNVGDALLFMGANSGDGDIHFVTSTNSNAKLNQTLVTWDTGLGFWANSDQLTTNIFVFRRKVGLFGAQAPYAALMPASVTTGVSPGNDWPFAPDPNTTTVPLDAVYSDVFTDQSSDSGWLVLQNSTLNAPNQYSLFAIAAATQTALNKYTVTSKSTVLQVTSQNQNLNSLGTPPGLTDFITATRSTTAYVQSERLTPCDQPLAVPGTDFASTWTSDPTMLLPVQGTGLVVLGGEDLAIGDAVAILGLAARIRINPGSNDTFFPQGNEEGLSIPSGQIFIVNTFPPENAQVVVASGASVPMLQWQVTTTTGVAGMLQISSSSYTLISSDSGDPQASEAAVLSEVTVNGTQTTLTFKQALTGIYDRATVTVNGNVAPATHGETMHEILGNGDATNPNLTFSLKQSPLTYVSSSSGQGATSTLQVWVNNLRWHEAGNFLSGAPADRNFISRPNSDQTINVQFGDGITSARTPTGSMNIRAIYRKGIGLAGMVNAGQISQPIDRPQGLQSATNPSAPSGGADPDGLDSARASAPLQVLTLGRVVSLEDYQNYALAFQGISKALATWTWSGRARCVYLTIAGAGGHTVQPTDALVVNLITALHAQGNPHVPITVASYSPVRFTVAANVRIDTDDYDPTAVLAGVWESLSSNFSFDERQLGEGVAQSQVISLIQQISGVIAVELTLFCRNDQPQSQPQTVLRAASPVTLPNGTVQSAELLTIDPASQGQIVGAK